MQGNLEELAEEDEDPDPDDAEQARLEGEVALVAVLPLQLPVDERQPERLDVVALHPLVARDLDRDVHQVVQLVGCHRIQDTDKYCHATANYGCTS